jgi:hypothetical protein
VPYRGCGQVLFPERLRCASCGSGEFDTIAVDDGQIEAVTSLERAVGLDGLAPVRLAAVVALESVRSSPQWTVKPWFGTRSACCGQGRQSSPREADVRQPMPATTEQRQPGHEVCRPRQPRSAFAQRMRVGVI